MKLQRQKAYTYETEAGEKIHHYKHLVNIPDDALEELGWKSGVELEPVVEKGNLILRPTKASELDEPSKQSRATDITRPKRLNTPRRESP